MGSTISSMRGSEDHEHYRALAKKNADLRGQCFEQSRMAYRAGNGAKAKELSNQGKEYGREMERYNNLAKNLAFKTNNANRPKNELDLHGLTVAEALQTTRERLGKFVRNKEPNLIIIVGRGNNSLNGIAKIKPAVTTLLDEFHVKATPNKPNDGCIYVEPRPAGENADYSWIDGFFKGVYNLLVYFFKRS